MKKYFILICLAALLLNCSGDDENFEPTDIDLVTGLHIRNMQESTPTRLGNPNIITQDLFITYPNPAVDYVWITSSETISNAWIIPAKSSTKFRGTDFSKNLNSGLYSKEQIAELSVVKFEDLSWKQIGLDIENLNSGYYRIFVEIEGGIFGDNIYVSKDPEASGISLSNYWN